MNPFYAIGIDPGAHTGIAVWNISTQRLEMVDTMEHVEALFYVEAKYRPDLTLIVFEDARKRQWFGNSGREKLQGAGSVKARSTDWEKFARLFGYRTRAIAPQSVNSINDAATFKRITGWTGRTSVHSRDAAMMVFGMGNILSLEYAQSR